MSSVTKQAAFPFAALPLVARLDGVTSQGHGTHTRDGASTGGSNDARTILL